MGKVIQYGKQPSMSVPVPCPYGCGHHLTLDLRKDHQHITCQCCGSEFCIACTYLPSIDEAEKEVAEKGADVLHSFLRA